MLTYIDKAIAALLPGILLYLNQKYGFTFNTDPATMGALAGLIGSVLVYFVPNKDKPPSTPPKASIILIGFIVGSAMFMHGSAFAADNLPTKATKNPLFSNSYPYQTSGLFFGLFTEGGGGPVNGSVPGVGSSSLTTTQAGVGGTIGYAWGAAGSPIAYSIEGDFGWTNFNGSVAGFSLSGPLAFEQRFVAFTPLNQILSLLPNLNLGTIPPFPPLPTGITASNLQLGLMAGLDENDISPNFPGLEQNREWRIAPMIGLVAMEQLSNGVALRSWIKTVFPDKSVCVGPVGSAACAGLGQQVKVGVGLYF